MQKQIDWRKIRKGDKAVFDKMFDFYFLPLCEFTSSYIKNAQVVEDIVIECFSKIWEDRSTLQIKNSLQNFLLTIAKNAAISYLRKNQVEFSDLENVSDSVTEEDKNPLEDAVMLNKLYESIAKLPEQRRRILKMAAFEGKSYPQIADELNISVNTVKTQMSRSYKFLKEQLNVQKRTIDLLLLA